MCLGIPGQIVELVDTGNNLATVDVSGVKRTINVGLLEAERPQPGDWVLIHVGFAMSKIDEAEAALTLSALQALGRAYQEEIESFRSMGRSEERAV